MLVSLENKKKIIVVSKSYLHSRSYFRSSVLLSQRRKCNILWRLHIGRDISCEFLEFFLFKMEKKNFKRNIKISAATFLAVRTWKLANTRRKRNLISINLNFVICCRSLMTYLITWNHWKNYKQSIRVLFIQAMVQ